MAGTITRGVVVGRGVEMAVGDGVALPRCSGGAAGVALAGVGCSNRSSCTVIGVLPLLLLLLLQFPALDDDVDDCSAFDATTVCGVGSGDKINEPIDDAVATLPGVWRSLPSSPPNDGVL